MRWIIGDIHGMLRPLERLVSAIERHDRERQLLFVGDYVNRGPDSRGVIDLLLSLATRGDAHFVRGNHDDVFDHVLSSQSYCGEPGDEYRKASFHWFMQHGLDKTFLSYGVSEGDLHRALRRPNQANLDFLVDAVPETHRKFIRNLPVVLESDDLFVGHAKWDVFTPTEDPPLTQRLAASQAVRYTLLWGRYRRDELEFSEKPWQRTGYFGHTPVDNYMEGEAPTLVPILGSKIVLLDTAAALVAHGRLTAFCHESQSFIQVDATGNLVVPGIMTELRPHKLKVALVAPQIAPNTGNIARLCVATGTELHLVRPLGFVLSDKEIRRSAMDYWPRLKLTVHDDLETFERAISKARRWLFSTKGERSHFQTDFQDGDWLIFGNETHGLPPQLLAADASRVVRIPQAPGERCLNLSTAAGIGLYEAMRRL